VHTLFRLGWLSALWQTAFLCSVIVAHLLRILQ
jgi:hypothetical protein